MMKLKAHKCTREEAEKKESVVNVQIEKLTRLVLVNVKEEMDDLAKEQEFFSLLDAFSRKVDETLRARALAGDAYDKALEKQEATYALFITAAGSNHLEDAMESSSKLAVLADVYKKMIEASTTVAMTLKRKKQAKDKYAAALAAFHDKESELNNKKIEWQNKKIGHHKTFLAMIEKKQEFHRLHTEGSTTSIKKQEWYRLHEASTTVNSKENEENEACGF
jgi:hypothetical protein